MSVRGHVSATAPPDDALPASAANDNASPGNASADNAFSDDAPTKRIDLGRVVEFQEFEGFDLLHCSDKSEALPEREDPEKDEAGSTGQFEFQWTPSGRTFVCDAGGLAQFDVNFDGHLDFAVALNNDGPYGSTTFQVFIYQPSRDAYVHAPSLTELTYVGIGLFETDAERGRLVVSGKNGCCIHFRDEYIVRGIDAQRVQSRVERLTWDPMDNCSVVTTLETAERIQVLSKKRCTGAEGASD